MKFFKDIKKNISLLLMALPGLGWFVAFCYVPMFGIIIAFKDYRFNKGIFGSDWVGLKNFEYLFKTSDAWLITRNTILYNVLFIILGMFTAVLFAIMFDALGKRKINRINQTVVLFPHFISWVVGTYFGFTLLSADMGVLNKVVEAFGGEPINWYSEAKYWPFILPLFYLWKHVGYSSIIYYSNIRGFDTEYYEAARIDGATWFQSVRYITLPLLIPILTIMFILNIGGVMHSDFGLFYLVPKNSGMLFSTTATIDTYVYNGITAAGGGNMGATAAVSFYQSIIGFVLVLTSNLIVRRISPENAMF